MDAEECALKIVPSAVRQVAKVAKALVKGHVEIIVLVFVVKLVETIVSLIVEDLADIHAISVVQ